MNGKSSNTATTVTMSFEKKLNESEQKSARSQRPFLTEGLNANNIIRLKWLNETGSENIVYPAED